MDLGLSGKRALVTGSTAGIGLAAATALAAEGASVVVNGRTPARVSAAVASHPRRRAGRGRDGHRRRPRHRGGVRDAGPRQPAPSTSW